MQDFLSGKKLAKKIREVCKGDGLRIAVAYWGKDIPEALSLNESSVFRIICDISSGGTNPMALKSLGAPNNAMLRHVHKLHAKVYISALGCVVGSANASENGIGSTPKTLEAGIYCGLRENSGAAASNWFEDLWRSSDQIDADAMELCEENWRRTASSRAVEAQGRQSVPATVPELLQENPEAFSDIKFLLTNSQIDREARNMALELNKKDEPNQDPTRFCLFGWEDDDKREVPPRFINIHRGPQGGYWLSLLTPGFLRPEISVYCAVPHRLEGGAFSELDGILELMGYKNWQEGGAGYRIGKKAFDAHRFANAVDYFYTAEELSELLFNNSRP